MHSFIVRQTAHCQPTTHHRRRSGEARIYVLALETNSNTQRTTLTHFITQRNHHPTLPIRIHIHRHHRKTIGHLKRNPAQVIRGQVAQHLLHCDCMSHKTSFHTRLYAYASTVDGIEMQSRSGRSPEEPIAKNANHYRRLLFPFWVLPETLVKRAYSNASRHCLSGFLLS